MKRVVFIISHLASGSAQLVHWLNHSDRINIQTTFSSYDHPTDLLRLYNTPHKCKTPAAIYGDHLLHNISFQCKRLYDWCEFIYIMRGGRDTLQEVAISQPYTEQTSYRYYCFRIRRIYEMAKRSPRAAMITWNDLITGRAIPFLEQFLRLRQPLPRLTPDSEMFMNSPFREIAPDLLSKSQDCFEYYRYRITQLPHIKIPNQSAD